MSTPPPIPPEPTRSEQMSQLFTERDKRPAQAPPPPRKGMNGCLIAFIIAAVLSIPAIAILAAIAIPQYHEYLSRSRVMMGVQHAQALKPRIDQYVESNGTCPDNAAIDLESDTVSLGAESTGNSPQATITVGAVESGQCAIELRFSGVNTAVDGSTLLFVSNQGAWQCSGGTLPERFKPSDCKYPQTTE